MDSEHVDVLIVGAGLSGIGAAHHLQERCPGKSYAILEAREAIGGTWDLFRYPGIRSDSDMHTLGYRFRPWTDGEVDRRRRLDPRLRARHRPRGRHRPHDPLPPPVVARRLVERGGALDGRRRARRRRARRSRSPAASSSSAAATTATTRATRPSSRGSTTSSGEVDPPPALARGPRLRRQAGRRDRQRRDRGDAGPGDGRATPPHVTMLQRSPTYVISLPGEDPIANGLRRCLPRPRRLSDRALEERRSCRASSTGSAAAGRELIKKLIRNAARRSAAAGLRRRHALQAALQPLGPAPLPGPRRRPLQGRSPTAAPRSSPTASTRFTRAGSSSSPGAGSTPTSSSPRPASTCSSSAACEIDVDGERARPAAAAHLQGDDAERRPQPRLHDRLHQRLLDAEGRPRRRIRLPPAQPHGRRAATTSARPDVDDPSRRPRSRCSTSTPATSCARSPSCRSRARRSRGSCARTTRSTCGRCATAPVDDGTMVFSNPAPAVQVPEPATQSLASSS